MINIICLKWGTKYGPEYVNKLYRAVSRNVTVPYNFICFTDSSEGVECNTQPIPYSNIRLQTWWNKVKLFGEDTGLDGKTLFLDLDTVIVDNIDHIISCPQKGFFILQDFYRWKRQKGLQSSIMMWNHEDYRYVWINFANNVRRNSTNPYGDQGYMEQALKMSVVHTWQNLFPDEFVSYKVHCKQGLPENAKVAVFHGNPRPHMVKDKWVIENW